jgi:hypothetical protein
MLEVGTAKNAEQIFEHFDGTAVNMFAQKTGWQQVTRLPDMPTSYREGTLFLSAQAQMPWSHQ